MLCLLNYYFVVTGGCIELLDYRTTPCGCIEPLLGFKKIEITHYSFSVSLIAYTFFFKNVLHLALTVVKSGCNISVECVFHTGKVMGTVYIFLKIQLLVKI